MEKNLFTKDDFAGLATTFISSQFLADIANFEGFRPDAYTCSAGVYTIGFGHTSSVHKGDTISLEAAKKMLFDDVLDTYMCLQNQFSTFDSLPQCYRNMLVDLAFNCGTSYFRKSSGSQLYETVLSVSNSFHYDDNVSETQSLNTMCVVLRYCHICKRLSTSLLKRRLYFVKDCFNYHYFRGYKK